MTEKAKTVIVFGKGRVAIRATELLLNDSYDVTFVVPSSTEVADDRSFGDWANEKGMDVRRISRLGDLGHYHADLEISAYFGRIFRQRHIDRFGMLLNVHNSGLPKYRGMRPINWAVKNGETSHGVSLHVITSGIDEGDIVAQEAFEIDAVVDEVLDVYWRCIADAETMLERAWPHIWALTPIPPRRSGCHVYSAADDVRLGAVSSGPEANLTCDSKARRGAAASGINHEARDYFAKLERSS